ncbi:MAG TPA: molybdate ABC transporter substrate-binding protein [Acidimicrobiales bacterium]|nr:molybdate ABC transporter substrate-binding protein [Acidimicrobiales bacterium]
MTPRPEVHRRGAAIGALVAAAAALLVLAAACSQEGSPAVSGPSPSGSRPGGTVSVFAAASLTEVFTTLASAFEARNPGTKVTTSFGGSSSLAEQIRQGAPADVFASADEVTMAPLVSAGLVEAPTVVARNRLTLVVERGDPKGIRSLADLGRPGTVLVLCSAAVPCGRLGAAALQRAGVTVTPASLEDNVKSVVNKVALGEADAGIVYVTDAAAAGGKVDRVAIDGADDAALAAVYPMAIVKDHRNDDGAKAWMTCVTGPDGRRVLRAAGFLAP